MIAAPPSLAVEAAKACAVRALRFDAATETVKGTTRTWRAGAGRQPDNSRKPLYLGMGETADAAYADLIDKLPALAVVPEGGLHCPSCTCAAR